MEQRIIDIAIVKALNKREDAETRFKHTPTDKHHDATLAWDILYRLATHAKVDPEWAKQAGVE